MAKKMFRAFSVLTIKAAADESRIIEGIATTPAPDRMSDQVITDGIEFSVPLPFLYQHNSRQPIGQVLEASVKADGMKIKAQLAPAGTAPFIDEAWALIKAGLIRGLSIGFRSLEESWDKTLGGYKYLRTELLEISAVTIPANAEASITAVKSADLATLAAFGRGRRDPVRLDGQTSPGAPGTNDKPKGNMKTIAEQIAAFEAKRLANVARMSAIMDKSSEEGRTLNAEESQEYDGLEAEVTSVDEHLVRLRAHEAKLAASAVPVTIKTVDSPEAASRARAGVITVKGPDLPKGTAFTRYAIALAIGKGNLMQALEVSKRWKESTPEIERILRTAVDAGTTTDSGWASQLADYTYMASEFIEFLRPMTIIGKIPGLRRVPFNIKMPLQDAGSSAAWVGEGAFKPLSKLNFDTVTLRFAKAAGIVVLTDELIRFSNPSAEAIVRADLAAAIAQFLDEQFIDPSITESINVSPASVTNGASNDSASGTDADDMRADFKKVLTAMLAGNVAPDSTCRWVMSPVQAVSLGLMLNPLGQPEFPSINAEGGSLLGYGVVTSQSVASQVVTFLKASEIMLADDGQVTLDASREASIAMDDGSSPTTATIVSMWQNNMVALRAERYVNWARRRDEAVYYLTGCDYK